MARHHVDLLTELNAQDEINMTAAFINVTTQLGTVLGTPPAEKLEDRWLIAMYHRCVLGGVGDPRGCGPAQAICEGGGMANATIIERL